MKTMLFNPYSGKPRHPSDIKSDPSGILMLDPDEPIRAYTAPPKAQPINQKLLTALSNLLGQVEKFTVENGEADFETAEALSVINEVAANDSADPKAQPSATTK